LHRLEKRAEGGGVQNSQVLLENGVHFGSGDGRGGEIVVGNQAQLERFSSDGLELRDCAQRFGDVGKGTILVVDQGHAEIEYEYLDHGGFSTARVADRDVLPKSWAAAHWNLSRSWSLGGRHEEVSPLMLSVVWWSRHDDSGRLDLEEHRGLECPG